MAPNRGKGKTRAAKTAPAARTARSAHSTEDAVPDVYEEMLAEEARRNPPVDTPERPLKRRRVVTGVRDPPATALSDSTVPDFAGYTPQTTVKGEARARPVQTVEASSDGESEAESEFAFEDVDLDHGASPGISSADDDIADVSIAVEPTNIDRPTVQSRRKPVSNAEKAFRLLVHKAHVLCLLGHCMYVNTWCNDINVQQHLHPLLSKKVLSNLQGREDYTQFQRDRAFSEGLVQASDVFRGHFKINASGMKRAMWAVNEDGDDSNSEVDPVGRHELITAAREMEGSQDVGNQLFCALLRSAGVDARLVCSIQPLPLTTVQAKRSTPQKPPKPVIRAMPPYGDPATSDSNTEHNAVKSSSTIGKVPSARRRLGQPSFNTNKPAPVAALQVRKKPVRKLDYPIFWVEAFNTAHQKWTAVDPLVTRTIGKPSKFEPPAAYALNQMSYVIAFEDDGVVRDVTLRYVKAYNAKTRRNRVESSEGGMQWLRNALRLFRRRGGALDRDQTEDAELNQKEAKEGLPGNVQDFKEHPVYALERHLKRHEMIEPKREVGKVNAGTAAKPRMEPVYRRSDVVVCRSADKWYRLGRVIQAGQAPIKHVHARNSRRGRSLSPDAEAEVAGDAGQTALYANYQTEAYVAPSVVNAKVPRNAFGNLDIYAPSMVPPGGTHVRHALAQQAARILRVDYADAVTGFKFKGRHGTAVIEGAIVPSEHVEAIEVVIEGLLSERLEEESLARSAAALRMWKRFLTGLRIKERVDAYGTDGEAQDVREEIDRQVDEHDEIAEAGGFFAAEPAMPTAGKFSLVEMTRAAKLKPGKSKSRARKEESESEEAESSGGEDSPTAAEMGGPPRRSKRARQTAVVQEDEDDEYRGVGSTLDPPELDDSLDLGGGGGFLPDGGDDNGVGGGFVPQDADAMESEGAGGFLLGDEAEGAGGTLLQEESDRSEGTENVGEGPQGGGFVVPDDETLPVSNAAEAKHEYSTLPLPPNQAVNDGDTTNQANHDSKRGMDSDPLLSMHGALPNEPEEQQAEMEVDETHPLDDAERDEDAESEGVVLGGGYGESDHGSMISHDPDDEDAEPDWLESD